MPGAPLRIFVSYSRTDSAFVDQLEARLQARGFDTWVDRSKLVGGDPWLKEIQQQVDRCDVCLVVISPEAIASEYVSMEYRRARRRKKRVIPLYLRFIPDEDWPIDLEELHRVDFQNGYQQGLGDLLLALRRQEIAAPRPSGYAPLSEAPSWEPPPESLSFPGIEVRMAKAQPIAKTTKESQKNEDFGSKWLLYTQLLTLSGVLGILIFATILLIQPGFLSGIIVRPAPLVLIALIVTCVLVSMGMVYLISLELRDLRSGKPPPSSRQHNP